VHKADAFRREPSIARVVAGSCRRRRLAESVG
jgi:hypothetical protein